MWGREAMDKETEEYLAKIRKTVADARAMVESVNLRLAETDRLLEKQGLTREQLRAMTFTPEQEALVDAELKRLGLPPLAADGELASMTEQVAAAQAARIAEDGGETDVVENRTRKFGSMMQSYRL